MAFLFFAGTRKKKTTKTLCERKVHISAMASPLERRSAPGNHKREKLEVATARMVGVGI
jgi:hypothetical protein